jgi:D-alanyl-lipoteichoic acid acyltransferase DltB (MBOAT superfamily)
MIINYILGSAIGKTKNKKTAKFTLSFGIILNLLALGYYKYYDFFVENLNTLFDSGIQLLNLTLPLAISFFTFQQVAYLVDAYRNETQEYSFWNYSLFVSFFPQLIAGPIVHHKEMMPQFSKKFSGISLENISKGIVIFSIGLFKKVVIADHFAKWATAGFESSQSLTFIEAWITSYSYTFQLYFDFSGYTDMAIGAALFFNIRLPINFNSPYKAVNIQDFWKRWHITLTRFLTQYLYIPLGGNRKGRVRTYINIFLVFFLSGLWHGAGWTFIFWGVLHGVASMINRFWQRLGFKMNKLIGWFITFQFVNIAWVFFRAESWQKAISVLKGMIGLNGMVLPEQYSKLLNNMNVHWVSDFPLFTQTNTSLESALLFIIVAFVIVLGFHNSIVISEKFKQNWFWAGFVSLLIIISILSMSKVSEFLYFNF